MEQKIIKTSKKIRYHIIPYLLLLVFLSDFNTLFSQSEKLALNKAISIAQDSSLMAFRRENMFLSSYWGYRSYMAGKRPSLNLSANPVNYNRSMSSQFNAQDTSYNYYLTQTMQSDVGLSIDQNLTFSGGRLSLSSEMERLQNFRNNKTEYSFSPVSIGIYQPLFGFNSYKWAKKTEPLKFEKAKKSYVQGAEDIAIQTVNKFFALAIASHNLAMARTNATNADSLYRIGEQRFKLVSITYSDLLNLKLELVNSRNKVNQAVHYYDRELMRLQSFLNLKDSLTGLLLPEAIPQIIVNKELALQKAKENNPSYLNFMQKLLDSKRDVERAKKESRFSSTFTARLGFTQKSDELIGERYAPENMQIVNFSLKIPIIDWGVSKGKYKLVQKQADADYADIKQQEIELNQELCITVDEFNLQSEITSSAKEAAEISLQAYEAAKERFIKGLGDVNTVIVQLERKDAAQRSYIQALADYWGYYYLIRRLTLYDFENNCSLTDMVEKEFEKIQK